MTRYWYLVGSETNRTAYSGSEVGEAMAAFTTAVLDGDEYVTFEALREPKETGNTNVRVCEINRKTTIRQ